MATEEPVQPQAEPDRDEGQAAIVKKVSGSDLDRAIRRLSEVTAPYFRSGGLLMPDEQ